MTDVALSLYAKLRDSIRASILDGELKPLDKLPSESQLAATHGVSRITVRHALNDLQKDGLIVRQQGKGAFVSAPRRASQSLNRLQGLGEALSAQGHAVHGKRLLMKRMKAPTDVAEILGLLAGEEVWHMISLRYMDREPISVNSSYFPLHLGERVARLDLSGRDVIDVLERDLGKVIAQAKLEISAMAMPVQEGRWLKVSPGTPALCVQRVLCDTSDERLQAETITYRADAFSYKLSLAR
jgi:GntR family transcriptional regulator